MTPEEQQTLAEVDNITPKMAPLADLDALREQIKDEVWREGLADFPFDGCTTCENNLDRLVALVAAYADRRVADLAAENARLRDRIDKCDRDGLAASLVAQGTLLDYERDRADAARAEALAPVLALLTSGPVGRVSGERYIRADLIRRAAGVTEPAGGDHV